MLLSVLDINDCTTIVKYTERYLQAIKEGKVEIGTLHDFEMLSSFAGLVAYMYKNKSGIVADSLDQWKEIY